MKDILVKDSDLILASQEGIDAFIKVISDAILNSIGGKLTCDNMSELNADQITLIAYSVLRDEVMDGGFVQLIYNGWGPFFFNNPFAKAIRLWGLTDLAPLINKANRLYKKHRADIEKDYTDDEFMELFERFPDFDDLDDKFVENEEQWTNRIAFYVDDNLDKFVTIVKD
ncbi:MAG: DMP19 family protein [Prevotella sp.]|nr:DMP19 family protein [Paraprevotella sp.]MDD5856146.1 DMP19 family protein [Prevotella sp.]MDD7692140.1 DMP19 family protein [Prevotella sp.]MDY4407596.1 DMP19 family protein [Prevotella sp.]